MINNKKSFLTGAPLSEHSVQLKFNSLELDSEVGRLIYSIIHVISYVNMSKI